MKNLKIIVIALIASFIVPSIASGNQILSNIESKLSLIQNDDRNLLQNPSFEGIGSNGIGEKWDSYGNASFTLVNNPVSSGSQAQKISVSNLGLNNFVSVSQTLDVIPNQPFRLSGRFRIEELVNSKVQLYADFYSETSFLKAAIFELHNDLTGDYVSLSGNDIVPSGAISVRIHALIRATSDSGAGSIYVDALNFSYTSDSNFVINPDFEQSEGNKITADGWSQVTAGRTELATVNYPVSSGVGAQQITTSEMSLQYASGIYQTIKVESNRDFRMSGRIRVDSLQNSKVQLYADFTDGTSFIGANITELSTVTNGSFITVTGNGKIPNNAKYVVLYVLIRSIDHHGAGNICVDSMSFRYQEEENSFENGSFEVFDESGIASGCKAERNAADNSQFQMVPSPITDGSAAQKISVSNLLNNQLAGVSQAVNVLPTQNYTVSGRVRIDSVNNARAYLHIDFYSLNGYVESNIVELPLTTYEQFITVSSMGVVPANAEFAKVHVIVKASTDKGAGVFYVDEMSLQYKSNLLKNTSFETLVEQSNVASSWVLSQPAGSIADVFVESNKAMENQKTIYSYSAKGLLNIVSFMKNGGKYRTIFNYDKNGNLLNKINLRSVISQNKVFDGIYSQKVAGYNLPENDYFSVSQTFVVQPSKPFEVYGNINVQMLHKSKVQMYIDFHGEYGKYLGSNITEYTEVNGQYVKLSNDGIVPENAITATLHFLIRAEEEDAAGEFNVDDVVFKYQRE